VRNRRCTSPAGSASSQTVSGSTAEFKVACSNSGSISPPSAPVELWRCSVLRAQVPPTRVTQSPKASVKDSINDPEAQASRMVQGTVASPQLRSPSPQLRSPSPARSLAQAALDATTSANVHGTLRVGVVPALAPKLESNPCRHMSYVARQRQALGPSRVSSPRMPPPALCHC